MAIRRGLETGRRIKKLELPVERGRSVRKGSLTIDGDTAELVRRVQHLEGLRLSDLIDRMLQAYIASAHPDWRMTVEDVTVGPFHVKQIKGKP